MKTEMIQMFVSMIALVVSVYAAAPAKSIPEAVDWLEVRVNATDANRTDNPHISSC